MLSIEQAYETRKDPASALARQYCNQRYIKLPFKTVRKRIYDLLTIDRTSEAHGKAWGIEKAPAGHFIKSVGFERRLPELIQERTNLATSLYWMILQKSATEDPAFCIAYISYHANMAKTNRPLSFKDTYARTQDLLELNYPRCAEKWNISPRAVSHFARGLGFVKRRRKSK